LRRKSPEYRGSPCTTATHPRRGLGRIKDLLPGREGLRASPPRTTVSSSTPSCGSPRPSPLARSARTLRQRQLHLAALRPLGTQGLCKKVFEVLQDPDLEWLILDSTIHPRPPARRWREEGPRRHGGQQDQALGRSRGGFGTRIHAAVSGLMLPVRIILTAGRSRRDPGGEVDRGPAHRGGDRRQGIRTATNWRAIEAKGGKAVIPPRSNRKEQRSTTRSSTRTQPGGALLAEDQAVPARGDALREDGPELPRLRPRRLHHGPAQVVAAAGSLNCPHDLVYWAKSIPKSICGPINAGWRAFTTATPVTRTSYAKGWLRGWR